MIFEKLKERDSAAPKRFGDVKADHGVEAKRLRSFARAVDYILAGQEFLCESFHLAVHDFIEHLLFPAAVKALRSEDRAEIDAPWMTEKDPLFNSAVEEKFNNLQKDDSAVGAVD